MRLADRMAGWFGLAPRREVDSARADGAANALAFALQQRASLSPLTMVRDAYLIGDPHRYSQHSGMTIKPGTQASPKTLRLLADSYDPARACISHLKREVSKVGWRILPVDEQESSPSVKRAIDEAENFFSLPGGFGGPFLAPRHVMSQVIEDVLVTGAYAMYCEYQGGYVSRSFAVDSLTIKPRIDAQGWPDEREPYEQWIMGVRTRGFSRAELLYDGLDSCSWQPYYRSPIEYLMAVILTAMSADSWNRDWLTDGTTPGELLMMPQDWTPDQIKEFAEWWTLMAQSSKSRRQMRMAPSGSRVHEFSRRDQEFAALEAQLIRRTCSIFGVSPIAIGYEGSAYKVSQDGAQSQTSEIGVSELLEIRKDLVDQLLIRLGFPFLKCVNVAGREEAAGELANRLVKASGGAYITTNEARREAGLDPIEGGDDVKGSIAADPAQAEEERAEEHRWMVKAIRSFRSGKGAAAPFKSAIIALDRQQEIRHRLERAESEGAIRAAFAQ